MTALQRWQRLFGFFGGIFWGYLVNVVNTDVYLELYNCGRGLFSNKAVIQSRKFSFILFRCSIYSSTCNKQTLKSFQPPGNSTTPPKTHQLISLKSSVHRTTKLIYYASCHHLLSHLLSLLLNYRPLFLTNPPIASHLTC